MRGTVQFTGWVATGVLDPEGDNLSGEQHAPKLLDLRPLHRAAGTAVLTEMTAT